MDATFQNIALDVEPDARAIRVGFLAPELPADALAGWQVYDPNTGTFISEGEWKHAGSDRVELRIALPPEPGPYRIYVSCLRDGTEWDYQRGRRFLLIDTAVRNGRGEPARHKVTTLAKLRWDKRVRAIPKALTYPVLTILRNRRLIRSMVRRDISARYRGSFGDVLWTVLNPLLLMSTYFFVFGIVLRARFGADNSRAGFVLYLLAGMLPWLPFSEAAGRAPFVVLEHRNFVKKLVFPLETLPINLVVASLVTEMFALGLFLACLVIARGNIPLSVLWLPMLLIPQLLLTLGVCWFAAALGVFVRDLGQIMGFLLTLFFFLTPICYPEQSLQSLPAVAFAILKKNDSNC